MFLESVIYLIVASIFLLLAILTACEEVDPSDLLSISLGQLRVAHEQLDVQRRQLQIQSDQIALQRQMILAMQSTQPLWLNLLEYSACCVSGWLLLRLVRHVVVVSTRRRRLRQVAQIPGLPQAVPAQNRQRVVPLPELVEMDRLRGFARMKNYFTCSQTPFERRLSGGTTV